MKDRSIPPSISGDQAPSNLGHGSLRQFPLGLCMNPQSKWHHTARPREQGKWRILWVALTVSIFIAICTDGYLFALAISCGLSVFMLVVYLREKHIDHRQCYLRLEWILGSFSLPILTIAALIPLQAEWYPVANSALPHIGLHIFFPAIGFFLTTCLLERYCLRRITMVPDGRDERRLQLARLNKFQWLAWVAWRVACVSGCITGGTLLEGLRLSALYFPTLPSLLPTILTAEGSVCFIGLSAIFVCAFFDLRRKR